MSRHFRKQRPPTVRYIMKRMQHRTSGTASAEMILNFTNRFFVHLERDIESQAWSKAEVAASHRYITSLLMGDGLEPDGTPQRVAEAVRRRFAFGCVLRSDVHPNCFPGQAQPWYPDLASQGRWNQKKLRLSIAALYPHYDCL